MNNPVRTRLVSERRHPWDGRQAGGLDGAGRIDSSFFVTPSLALTAAEWFVQASWGALGVPDGFDWHFPCISSSQDAVVMNTLVTSADIEAVAQDEIQAMAEPNDPSENHDEQHESDVAVVTLEAGRPPFYAVVLFNDDYTPMEFVIEVLQQYFGLDLDRATEVMLSVHYQGKGVAGVYPRDIAETKAQQVNRYARSQGHPLLCQIEPQASSN